MALLRYSEFEPHPSLAGHVLSYWEFAASPEQAPFVHHVMPDGCVVLAYGRHGEAARLHLVGPSQQGFQVPVQPSDTTWGIRFWPDAASALLDLDPVALRDQRVLVTQVMPALAASMLARLVDCRTAFDAASAFDAILLGRLASARPLDNVVRQGVEAVVATEGQGAIQELAHLLGYSERQFQRRFRRKVGLTPKQFARIRRLRSSVANAMRAEGKGWGRVAAEQGFADQAHLVREFSQLTGESPTTFLERLRAIVHVNVTP